MRDERGYFAETWNCSRHRSMGLHEHFVQDNVSWSVHGVLRGLHLQHPHGQAKLVSVLLGEIFDVAVDVRFGSPTFARWFGIALSNSCGHQVYIPSGFAHGFCVVSEAALVSYKCTNPYCPDSELSIAWNDPSIGIDWPLESPTLSPKDAAAHYLDQVLVARLPKYDGTNLHSKMPPREVERDYL